jgi:hypothetical protein
VSCRFPSQCSAPLWLRQVHQYLVSCRIAARHGRAMPWFDIDDARVAVARRVFEARSRNRGAASRLQQQVAETLRGMGMRVAVERLDRETGYSVDVLVLPPKPALEEHRDRARFSPGMGPEEEEHRDWARATLVEVDGPRHFALPGLREPLGHTALKRRQLQGLGRRLVSVPFWEWPPDATLDQRRAYLRLRLQDPPHHPGPGPGHGPGPGPGPGLDHGAGC